MSPEDRSVTLEQAFEEALRDFGEMEPLADFSLEDATELVRADRDGRATWL